MKFSRAILFVLFFCLAAQAANEQRWLLIFDTSAAMKKRLAGMEVEIGTLLMDSAGGKLRAGDSIGVWAFDEKLRTGQFPLNTWQPADAPIFVTNLAAFIRQQKYSGTTKFDTLQPMLSRVIADSERLTILIFCDGADQIRWTPYDDGINTTLEQTAPERKKSQQPAVVLLRTQMGKYTGATVNFPPAPLNFPVFPPLPREIKPVVTNPPVVAAAVKAVPPAPPAAPLIIVGTHVSTNANDLTNSSVAAKEPTERVAAKTNLPTNIAVVAVAIPPKPTNTPKPAIARTTNLSALNPAPIIKPIITLVATNPAPSTNIITATVTTENHFSKLLIGIGVALFALAAVLVGFLIGKRRRPQGSLITSSMREEIPPAKRK